MTEIWKPVLGYEGLYEVSSIGRVRSLDRWVRIGNKNDWLRPGRIMKQKIREGGYLYVDMYDDGGASKHKRIHIMVCEEFRGPRPAGMQVCHNDGAPTNNTVENLRWGTAKENQRDRVKHGTSVRGEGNPNSRLTESDVLEIRAGRGSKSSFGISKTHFDDIKAGRKWAHIPMGDANGPA
tara:strand:- start:4643 stop:5182 length:540 start_codon:yes stop_codon:yes gene_type:complete